MEVDNGGRIGSIIGGWGRDGCLLQAKCVILYLLLLIWILTSMICFPFWFYSWWNILFQEDKLSKHFVLLLGSLKVNDILELTSQKCAIQQGCFALCGKEDWPWLSRVVFKEILLLRVSFSAGNIFLVTVCQGQQSHPLAFQEDLGYCCKQEPDSPDCARQVDPSIKGLKKNFQKNWHQGSTPWTCKKRLQVRFKYCNEPFSRFEELFPIYI